jgi:hypothetical protein
MNKSKTGQQKGKEKYKKVRNDPKILPRTFRFNQNRDLNLSNQAQAVAVSPRIRNKTLTGMRFSMALIFRLLSYLTFANFLFKIDRTENFIHFFR